MYRTALMVVLVLLCLNSLSFILARIVLYLNGGTAARLDGSLDVHMDGATFLIAGNLNWPRPAFRFLKEELSGPLVYADFQKMGWSARATAEKIASAVEFFKLTFVDVYTISLGDHVARYLEELIGGSCALEIVAINPCTDVSFMRKPLGTLLKIGAPILELICHSLGWLSAIPIISTPGDKYSLILLADQYWSIAYDHPKHHPKHTRGVICSKLGDEDNDGLLENRAIRNYFDVGVEGVSRIITIKTGHGDTIGCAKEYLNGVRRFL